MTNFMLFRFSKIFQRITMHRVEVCRLLFRLPSIFKISAPHQNFSVCCVLWSHYDTLGISNSASTEQVKQAYIEKCKVIHPDVSTSEGKSHHEFVEINEAYKVLSNPQSRRIYDSHRGTTGYQYNNTSYRPERASYPDSMGWTKTPPNSQLKNELKFKIIPLTIFIVLVHVLFFFRWARLGSHKKLNHDEILQQEYAQYFQSRQRLKLLNELRQAKPANHDKNSRE